MPGSASARADGSLLAMGNFRFEMKLGATTLSSKSTFTGYLARIRPEVTR